MMFSQLPLQARRFSTLLALSLASTGLLRAQTTISTGAVFGEVVSLGGTPSDLIVDEYRGRVYAVSSGAVAAPARQTKRTARWIAGGIWGHLIGCGSRQTWPDCASNSSAAIGPHVPAA